LIPGSKTGTPSGFALLPQAANARGGYSHHRALGRFRAATERQKPNARENASVAVGSHKLKKPTPFGAGFKIETQRATALISGQIEICEPSKPGGQSRTAI
jgi:hypothetical protein